MLKKTKKIRKILCCFVSSVYECLVEIDMCNMLLFSISQYLSGSSQLEKSGDREVLYWGKVPCYLPSVGVLGYSTDVSYRGGPVVRKKLLSLTSYHQKESGM